MMSNINEAKFFASIIKYINEVVADIKPETVVGPEGKPGSDGIDGAQGIQGIQGPKGNDGIQGPRGDKGDQGELGPTGETGLKGDQGEVGLTGEKGDKGDDGIQGPKGDIGPVGLTGPKGDKGERGEVGLAGSNGFDGKDGVNGKDGKDGLVGPRGDKGDAGLTGPKGSTGLKGDKGDKGDTGLTGPKGDQGEQGEQGEPGPAGSDADLTKFSKEFNSYQQKLNQQLASLGGGGSTRILDMDDVEFNYTTGLNTYDVLSFDASIGKFKQINIVDIINAVRAQLILEASKYTKLIDTDGNYTYIGEAIPGTATTAASWRIQRVDAANDPDLEIKWADSSADFDQVWDDRTTLTYS